MKWRKTGRAVKKNGETITYYESDQGHQIESRKRAIPHANNVGFWFHTSYFLIDDNGEKEFWKLQDAKDAAESGSRGG